jgi:DNA-binding FadR family transcriptional regulator
MHETADLSGTTPHAERGMRLAELILVTSRGAGQRAGSRLPTERQLSMDLGVTRSAVRHALGILEAQGHISREVGRGTFWRRFPERPLTDLLDAAGPIRQARAAGPAVSVDLTVKDPAGKDGAKAASPAAADFAPADVMRIRRLLEPPAMALVVAWATAADHEEMGRCLAGGDRAASYEEFETWDLALHRCIMAASHSPLLVALYAAIESARHGEAWGDLKRRSASAERRRQYQADHHAIVGALRSRDSGRAVEAMRAHVARVQEHLGVADPAAGLSWS